MSHTISFVIPSYNNLRYLKNAYRSIRQYAGSDHEIIILDDASSDGTVEWLKSLSDVNLVIWENTSGTRLGHTITYNIGGGLAKNEIFSILHADMFIGPNYVENAIKHMKPGVVVSATRIEPPLHPAGLEKIVKDFGMWPETFLEDKFLSFVSEEQAERVNQTTRGIFAPWFIHKKDFLSIGGHDPLFAPFPYEDSDIFQRFILAGYDIVQSRDSLVYHLTCRGHKWTDDTVIGKIDDSFNVAESKARLNYLRKWNSWIKNDEYHYPTVPPKFNTTAILKNVTHIQQLEALEPWFNKIIVGQEALAKEYILQQQPNTSFDMSERVQVQMDVDLTSDDVYVILDFKTFTKDDFSVISQLSYILNDITNDSEAPEGVYELGNIVVRVNKLVNINNTLIHC